MKNVYVLIQLLGAVVCAMYFPIGVIIGFILIIFGGFGYREESRRFRCPFCKEKIMKDAVKCRYCGKDLKTP